MKKTILITLVLITAAISNSCKKINVLSNKLTDKYWCGINFNNFEDLGLHFFRFLETSENEGYLLEYYLHKNKNSYTFSHWSLLDSIEYQNEKYYVFKDSDYEVIEYRIYQDGDKIILKVSSNNFVCSACLNEILDVKDDKLEIKSNEENKDYYLTYHRAPKELEKKLNKIVRYR